MRLYGAVYIAPTFCGHTPQAAVADQALSRYTVLTMETKTKSPRRKKTRQFVVDERNRRIAIVLPIEEYEALVEAAEDLADLRAADEARAEGGEPIPLERVQAELRAAGKLSS